MLVNYTQESFTGGVSLAGGVAALVLMVIVSYFFSWDHDSESRPIQKNEGQQQRIIKAVKTRKVAPSPTATTVKAAHQPNHASRLRFSLGLKQNKASRVEPALPQQQQVSPLPSHVPFFPKDIHKQKNEQSSPDRWSMDKEEKDDDVDYLHTPRQTRAPQSVLDPLQLQEESKHNSSSGSDNDSDKSNADGFVTPFEREQYYLSASSSGSASSSSSSSSSSSAIEYLEDIV